LIYGQPIAAMAVRKWVASGLGGKLPANGFAHAIIHAVWSGCGALLSTWSSTEDSRLSLMSFVKHRTHDWDVLHAPA
jgi:hypothetical protein